MTTIIPKDFKDCSKFDFLTKEIVYNQIKQNSKEWEASHDYWYGDISPFSNACNGYEANVIGDEYAKIEKDTFKVVVYALYYNNGAEEFEVDFNHVIFSFLIEGEHTTYKFESSEDADAFISSMPEIYSSLENMSKIDLARFVLQANDIRDIMYDFELDGTFDHECEMRDASSSLAELVLKECTKSTSLDALVDLIKNELQGATPSREELHTLVKKYNGDSDLEKAIKFVECEICFSIEVGVLVS